MTIWHLGFSSTKRGTLYPDEGQRRRAVRALVEAAGPSLVLFCLVNVHKHLLLRTVENIQKLGENIRSALSEVSDEALGDPWTEQVEGTKHQATLLRYILQQPSHHKIGVHDALWTGSCFQDMAGARVINGLRLHVWDVLPGVGGSVIYKHVGLPGPIEPLTFEQIRVLGPVRLVGAASAAVAADPLLRGTGRLAHRGRCLAVLLSRLARIPMSDLRWALQITKSSYHRAAQQPHDEHGMLAVRRRLALEEAAARATGCMSAVRLARRLGLTAA